MSEIPLWGTGIGPGAILLVRRITSEDDLRVTSEGDVRVASVQSSSTLPKYFQTANVAQDGGEQFNFRYETDPWQPVDPVTGAAQGGEHVFAWAYLALAWSMGATIKVTPFVDGNQDDVELDNGDILEIVPTTFVLPQQSGSLQRKTQVFPVPIVRRKMRDDAEIQRFYQRGERIQFLIESTGPLGTGELMLEGCELESEPVRKAIYPTTTTE